MQISVVNYTNLYESITFRIDAEFYHPEAIKYEKKILSQFHGKTLKGAGCHVVSGPFGSSLKSEAYLNKGIPFVRISDLRDFIISKDNLIYISEDDNERLSSSKLNVGDIVLSKVGNTIGVASKVTSAIGECNISENNIGIRMPSNMREQEKDLILAYLNSNPGQIQILRAISGNAQPKLNVSDIELTKIPQASDRLSDLISSLIISSESLLHDAQNIYQQAQLTVLAELGLSNWQPKHQLSFIKNYSEADKAGRIDAEYFQPKYDEIVKAIKNYPGGYSIVSKEFKQNKSVLKPDAAQTYQYVEIGSINVATGEISASDVVGAELPDNAKRVLRKDDVIVSKVRTYRGAMAIVDQDGLIGSGAFTALHENDQINKETLLTFLRSKPLLVWSLKPNTGTSYPVILDEDILNLPIPLFSEETQLKVKQKVTESFNLRKQSKHLLECAKKAVEIAIEENEDAAIKWLKEQTKANSGKTD